MGGVKIKSTDDRKAPEPRIDTSQRLEKCKQTLPGDHVAQEKQLERAVHITPAGNLFR
jgi:hypothetical protein